MAITIVDGVPGSGKTLYAINHLVENHYEKVSGLLEQKGKHVLYSNIDNLQLPHEDLNYVVDQAGGVKDFFSKEYQEKLFEKRGACVYVIDEAQFLFDRKFYSKEVFAWIQYHRHFGQTIYLVTQNSKNLPTEIQNCTEFIVRALPRSRALINSYFNYTLLSGRTVLGKERIRAKQELFDLYCSQKADTPEGTKKPFLKVLGWNLGLAALGMGLGIWYLFSTMGAKNSVAADSSSSVVQSGHVATYRHRVPTGSVLSSQSPSVPLFSWVKLNVAKIYHNNGIEVTFIFDGQIYSSSAFPFQVKVNRGIYYGNIPESVLARMAQREEI